MRLAANLSLMYGEWPFHERLLRAAEDGFEWVECLFPYEVPNSDWLTLMAATGVRWALFNAPPGNWQAGDRGLACDPQRVGEFRASVEMARETALALNAPCVHVMSGTLACWAGQSAGAPEATLRQHAQDPWLKNMDWLLSQTTNDPINWLIEPLNPRDMPGYFLKTQQQAHDLISQLDPSGERRIGVQMDLYHCQITEGDVVTKLRQFLPTGRVRHIQIAGVPERHEPDWSELNLPRVLDELRALGYQGALGCEYRPRAGTRAGLGWIKAHGFSGTMAG